MTIIAVFVALFAVITIMKNKPSEQQGDSAENSVTNAEKEKVIKFWENYRQATDFRLEGQWEEAAAMYRAALSLNGEHEDALYYLGNMYFDLSKFREAEECWQKLLQVNPKNSRAFRQLGILYLSSDELFDIGKAENACREALRLNREETGPLLSLGEVELIKGQLAEAAADFKAVTGSNFKSIEAYFLGGYIAWKKHDKQNARRLYSLAVKYSKPSDNPGKVLGEGDTKPGHSFGNVTSQSIFKEYIVELREVEQAQIDASLEKAYRKLDGTLAELKSKVL